MENFALERLGRLLSWMRPHEREIVLMAYVGRFDSAGEYARRQVAHLFDGELWWLAEHICYDALAREWICLGAITLLDDPGDEDVRPGVFVMRGSG